MIPYEHRATYFGQKAAGWKFVPSAAGPSAPGIRFTTPGHAGGWLPLGECEAFADALKAASQASSDQYVHRADRWAA